MTRRPLRLFAAACCLLVSIGGRAESLEGIDGFVFSVRMVNPAALPKDTSGEWLEFLVPGLASGALGLVAPPLYASGLVMGGLILVPGSLILSNYERKAWQQVTEVLKTVEFERDLLRALQRRATQVLPSRAGRAANVEVVVNGYGIVGKRPDKVCFIASASLVVQAEQDELLRSRLSILDAEGSVDAPPAQCASMQRFAENNGQMVRETAAEYAEVLAAMAIDRILAGIRR